MAGVRSSNQQDEPLDNMPRLARWVPIPFSLANPPQPHTLLSHHCSDNTNHCMSLSRHSAAGSNAGFSFQFERALYWLAKSPADSLIGIETADDVAVREPNMAQILEQDKHSVRENAVPFADRSKDLWNTLAIWVEAIETNQVPANQSTFLMVTNKKLPDCIAKTIAKAESEQEIAACIAALRLAGEDPPSHIATQVHYVLRPCSLDALQRVIRQCDVVDASDASAGSQLRQATIAELQLPEWCLPTSDSIANELLGWLHTTTLDAWQKGRPAWIQRNHFVNALQAIIGLRKRQAARERAEHLIPVTDDTVGQTRGRPFVKQLHLVTDDNTIVDVSIREFVRCNIEKSRLSAEGNVTDEDWRTFETTLFSRWEKIRARVLRSKVSHPEEDVGFEILTDTTEDHRERLAGSDTEQVYLTSGTYHRLADLVRVGWHPRFKALMQEALDVP